ncbi:6288_t:CDS:1, partial [Scutellospora calospora]
MITKVEALVKKKYLIAEEKKEICKKKQKFLSILNTKLAEDYGVKKICISNILKQSSK